MRSWTLLLLLLVGTISACANTTEEYMSTADSTSSTAEASSTAEVIDLTPPSTSSTADAISTSTVTAADSATTTTTMDMSSSANTNSASSMTVSNASAIIYDACAKDPCNDTTVMEVFHSCMVECITSTVMNNAVGGDNALMSIHDYLVEKANSNKRAAIAMSVLFVIFFFAFFYVIYWTYKNKRMLGQLQSNLPSSPRV